MELAISAICRLFRIPGSFDRAKTDLALNVTTRNLTENP